MRQSTSITVCVRWLIGRSVSWSVTHSFDDPHFAPYWPTWPCFSSVEWNGRLMSWGQKQENHYACACISLFNSMIWWCRACLWQFAACTSWTGRWRLDSEMGEFHIQTAKCQLCYYIELFSVIFMNYSLGLTSKYVRSWCHFIKISLKRTSSDWLRYLVRWFIHLFDGITNFRRDMLLLM